jgi:hypothetical protein
MNLTRQSLIGQSDLAGRGRGPILRQSHHAPLVPADARSRQASNQSADGRPPPACNVPPWVLPDGSLLATYPSAHTLVAVSSMREECVTPPRVG